MRFRSSCAVLALAGACTVTQAALAADASIHLWSDVRQASAKLTDTPSQWTLAVGALGTAGAFCLDTDARNYMRNQRRIADLDKFGNDFWGAGFPALLAGPGLWAYGAWRDDANSIRAGQSELEALVATSVVTYAIKVVVNRERPDQSDRHSFPSGHTSSAFAFAEVLRLRYGWGLGGPAFAIAAMTGAGRMQVDRHWFSDVASGALLGVWLGRAFGELAGEPQGSGAADTQKSVRWQWWPEPVEGGFGVGLASAF